MNRREFLKITGLGALLGAVGVKVAVAEPTVLHWGIWENSTPSDVNMGDFIVPHRKNGIDVYSPDGTFRFSMNRQLTKK